jgi:hypothetical protein
VPSAKVSALGTTVHPSLTPVKPAYLEKELTSMAHSVEPSISKIDLGSAAETAGQQEHHTKPQRQIQLTTTMRRSALHDKQHHTHVHARHSKSQAGRASGYMVLISHGHSNVRTATVPTTTAIATITITPPPPPPPLNRPPSPPGGLGSELMEARTPLDHPHGSSR